MTVAPVSNDADRQRHDGADKGGSLCEGRRTTHLPEHVAGCAPSMRLTVLFDAVVSVDPAWKMKTELDRPDR